MTLTLKPVTSDEDIVHLAQMADEIWHGYWPDIIGKEQTDYMVERFQSREAIESDIRTKEYRYWIAVDEEGNEVGFTGGAPEELSGDADHDAAISHSAVVDARWPRRFFISKIYLYPEQRGKHYASRIIDQYVQLCRNEGFPALYLTVNRGNVLGVRAYEGHGFVTVEEVDTDIGQGYEMNDTSW